MLGAVALHAPQDQGSSTRPRRRLRCARTRVRFDEDLIGVKGGGTRHALCGRQPDVSYVNRWLHAPGLHRRRRFCSGRDTRRLRPRNR
jgi:hypothetical protein